ncbi:DUF4224 domain-containing protein [Aquincola sp. S2]|uniref:DUF4224 domain-containing protein n=1 Tax=Pseudaquabacterium terrae TaxID=2732868 RepID=A0ABX2EP74_9BURK|nr:DUF4224 domain-containing protein [Aquabacterium terrae]
MTVDRRRETPHAWAPPDLTRDEIAEICRPLQQGAAQVRFLRSLGLRVERRPDGSPLVNRQHYTAVRGAVIQPAMLTSRDDWQPPTRRK